MGLNTYQGGARGTAGRAPRPASGLRRPRPDARPAPRHPAARSERPIRHATRRDRPGGSFGLVAGRDAGGAPGRRGNRVVPRGPRDLPVVAFGVGEVRIAALEEVRVRWFLRHGGAGLTGTPDEGVDVLR